MIAKALCARARSVVCVSALSLLACVRCGALWFISCVCVGRCRCSRSWTSAVSSSL
jgi:hypothetical protein